jgi:hypothetical protein
MIKIEDLEHKQPLFREFCEINGLKNGDYYKAADFIFWCDSLTIRESISIVRKYIPGFIRDDCNI